jgi:hypothetical protein
MGRTAKKQAIILIEVIHRKISPTLSKFFCLIFCKTKTISAVANAKQLYSISRG